MSITLTVLIMFFLPSGVIQHSTDVFYNIATLSDCEDMKVQYINTNPDTDIRTTLSITCSETGTT